MKALRIVMLSTFVTACGGGGSGGESSSTPAVIQPTTTVATEESSTGFADMQVPDNFDWQTHSDQSLNWQLVSNISFNQSEPMELAGSHVIRVYAVDENGIKQEPPLVSGLTSRQGSFNGHLAMPKQNTGVVVEVTFEQQTCHVVLSPAEIETTEIIDCEVLADSDL